MKSEHPLDNITERDRQVLKTLKSVREIRPDVLEFAYAMEMVLRKHDRTKGDSWKYCDFCILVEKLTEEFHEVEEEFGALMNYDFDASTENIQTEIVDLANIAMMIWDRARKTE